MRLSKGVVTLIFARYRHDCARAVGAEHVVRHVHGDFLAREGVDHVTTRKGATLVESGSRVARSGALHFAGRTGVRHQSINSSFLLWGRQSFEQRVLWRYYCIGNPKSSVWSSREHSKRLCRIIRQREVELNAFTSANPVALHGLHTLWPFQRVNIAQEFVSVIGNAEEPLLEVLALDHVSASLARSISQDLLIG